MTTPWDLFVVAMDAGSGGAVERGSLSLALAGAEAIDLLGVGALGLAGDRFVPGDRPHIGDPVLGGAASSLARQEPYESVEDWLWRRGRDLASVYLAALETEGGLTRPRRRLMPFRSGDVLLVDSPARRAAVDRWVSREPVLAALAAAVGMHHEPLDETAKGAPEAPDVPDISDDAVATVLAAVNDAVMELEAVRQRRAVEDAAFDNIWRGM